MFLGSNNVRLFDVLNYKRIIRALQLSVGRLLLTNECAFFLSCRTESVAEKMLTNWFAFLLHKFLKVKWNLSHTLLIQVSKWYAMTMLLKIISIDYATACCVCCCSCHFNRLILWDLWTLWRDNGYLWGQRYLQLCNSKGEKTTFYYVWCAMFYFPRLIVCADEYRSLSFPSFLCLIFLSPTFHSNPRVPFQNKGVCWRASLHAVLCHQTANGEGTHRLHHGRGTLFPQWGQTHPTADWIQDAGES